MQVVLLLVLVRFTMLIVTFSRLSVFTCGRSFFVEFVGLPRVCCSEKACGMLVDLRHRRCKSMHVRRRYKHRAVDFAECRRFTYTA